ncbi:MAG TPA: hypothetical protein VKC53_04450 [Patescibacteria group bacterium]|nr:hypothetical protein [Patescibacteria group bacterium]
MDKHQSRIIILACLLISGAIVFFASHPRGEVQTVGPIRTNQPIAIAKADDPARVVASDGKMSLTMREEKGKETTTYTFVAKNESIGSENQIYSKTVPLGTVFSIPLNTFSPDDKYLFLKETSASGDTYLAMTSSGALIKDAQTLDISSLFTAKYDSYKITDVTGWGGMTLIVVNTDKTDGGVGPSFWFDVTSKGFIRLSNRFN